MADVEIEDRGTALLPVAHRAVRILDPTEGPFAGALVTRGDEVAVRVDATALAGWVGWRFAGAEHVAGPIDVIRRLDGHDALLPWCTDRVLGLLVRRTAAGSALSSGECSTLVVSLLRGLDELGAGVGEVQTGMWWLTDGGRPTFVIGQGDDPRAGAAEIVARLAEDCGDKALGRVLRAVEQGLEKALTQPRVPRRSLEQWEQELLAIAAPRPLGRETLTPERSRDVARAAPADPAASLSRASRRGGRRRSGPPGSRALLRGGSAALMSALDVVRSRIRARPTTRTGRTERRATPGKDSAVPRSRRRVLLFAGAAAVAVLAGGLLWPTGDAADSANAAREQKPSAQPSDAASATPSADGAEREGTAAPTPPVQDDAAGAAAALWALIDGCREAEDLVCPAAVAPGSVGVVEALTATDGHEPLFEVVDEYGDVAVIRAGSSGDAVEQGDGDVGALADQMMVLVRQNEKWLVRDIYGVADQPG
jgi:hypothetical protein